MLKNHPGISVQTKYQQSLTMQALEITYSGALSTKWGSKAGFWGQNLKFHIFALQTAKNDFF